ncbi:GntR family transcriptional regulator [Streptomyces atratus]|uniref:GntR family transcriptional regulator n=1 Tax=Streptomyces atratus TaxID=1893 RepID=UPI00364F84EF
MGTSGPKYQCIKDELRAELARDEYVAGAPFITQNQLRERFGVSSTTAVRALNDLVAEGLLVRRRGLGTFVADPSDRTAEPASAHRSGVVACIISGQGPYQSEVLRGVESGCSERGLRLFFSDSAVRMTDTGHADHPASLARQDQALHQAVEDRVDGIILYPLQGAPDLDVLNETAGTSSGPSPGAGICPAPLTATSPWSTGRALYRHAGKRLPTSVAHALGLNGPL